MSGGRVANPGDAWFRRPFVKCFKTPEIFEIMEIFEIFTFWARPTAGFQKFPFFTPGEGGEKCPFSFGERAGDF